MVPSNSPRQPSTTRYLDELGDRSEAEVQLHRDLSLERVGNVDRALSRNQFSSEDFRGSSDLGELDFPPPVIVDKSS